MKTYLHSPMYFAKTLKLRFRVGDLDLPETRKRYTSRRDLDLPETRKRYTSSREEDEDAQMRPCGLAIV